MSQHQPHPVDALGVRDIDAESSKPKIENAEGKSKPPAVVNPPKTKPSRNKVTIKTPSGATDILAIYANHHLTPKVFDEPTTFIPCALQLYNILHQMDSLAAQNQHLLKMTRIYHPLISRLYYGILFLVQTLRCMKFAKTINARQNRFLTRFMKHYPPETLVIAGPLLPVFKSLSCSKSTLTAYELISPWLPDELGNADRSVHPVVQQPYSTVLPQVPLTLSLINSLKSSNDAAFATSWNPMPRIPAAGQPEIPILGYTFNPDTPPNIRWALCSPGITHPLETPGANSRMFRDELHAHNLPSVVHDTNCTHIEQFTQLGLDDYWFQSVLSAMITYCGNFKHTGSLADCPPLADGYSLLKSTPIIKQVPTPIGLFPVASSPNFDFRHQSFERLIDPGTAKLSMLSKVNVEFPANFQAPWTNAGGYPVQERDGPYYERLPHALSNVDTTGRLLRSAITPFYTVKPPK